MENIKTIISSVRNIMRRDRGVSGDAQRLEQLGWLFLKNMMKDLEMNF